MELKEVWTYLTCQEQSYVLGTLTRQACHLEILGSFSNIVRMWFESLKPIISLFSCFSLWVHDLDLKLFYCYWIIFVGLLSQETEAKAKNMQKEIGRLEKKLEERNPKLQASTSTTEKVLAIFTWCVEGRNKRDYLRCIYINFLITVKSQDEIRGCKIYLNGTSSKEGLSLLFPSSTISVTTLVIIISSSYTFSGLVTLHISFCAIKIPCHYFY